MATPTIRDRIKALRRVRAGDLIPSPKNWRTHPKVQRDALNGVLAQVGYADAILVREVDDGGLEIIDGHLRVEEADPNQEIPVLVLDVSEEEAALLLATHDPLGAMAYPDLDLYLPLIEDLNPDSEAVAALLEAVANNEARPLWEPLVAEERGLTDPDRVPDVDEKDAKVKLGQVWALGDHRLMCGDATMGEDVGTLLRDNKPLLMITDPPYGVGYDASWRTEAAEKGLIEYAPARVVPVTADDNPDWSVAFGLSPSEVVYCWHAGRHASLVQRSLETQGFEIRSQIVWVKQVSVITRGHYRWQHEPCWYAVRRGATAHWIGDHSEATVWNVNWDKNAEGGLSAQKPVECMERPMRNHEGDIYDPFVGSGTTIIAAEKTGRICYAMEIEPRYCDVAIRRWEEYTGNTAVLLEAQ